MSIERGDVYLARFPHASGIRGKRRPVVVVQLTTNLSDQDDPACLLVEAESPEGRAAGLSKDSLLSGYLLSLMSEDRLTDRIGRLPDETMQKVKHCLQAALDLG